MLNRVFDILASITLCVHYNTNQIQWLIATLHSCTKKIPNQKYD